MTLEGTMLMHVMQVPFTLVWNNCETRKSFETRAERSYFLIYFDIFHLIIANKMLINLYSVPNSSYIAVVFIELCGLIPYCIADICNHSQFRLICDAMLCRSVVLMSPLFEALCNCVKYCIL